MFAGDSKSLVGNHMRVRLPPRAPTRISPCGPCDRNAQLTAGPQMSPQYFMARTLGALNRRDMSKYPPEPPPISGARWIPLTHGRYALVDESDHARLASANWHLSRSGYAQRWRAFRDDAGVARRIEVWMHREVVGDVPVGYVVDHINGDRLDNRRGNLRIVRSAANASNAARRGFFVGVRRTRTPWEAVVIVDGHERVIGRFATPEEAARARHVAERERHGDFARSA